MFRGSVKGNGYPLHSPVSPSFPIPTSPCAIKFQLRSTFLTDCKRTRPFKLVGASFQSTTGSRGVRISGSNAGYTMFRGNVKGNAYPLHSPVSSFTYPPVRHRVPSRFNWSLLPAVCVQCTNLLFSVAPRFRVFPLFYSGVF